MSPDTLSRGDPEATPRPAPEPAGRGAGSDPLRTMTFLEHLDELRSTLFRMLIVAGVATTGAWFVSPRILDLLVPPSVGTVHTFGLSEGFMIRFKVSAITGLVVAVPFLLAQLWSFVAPGLFRHERRVVLPVVISSTGLFYLGVAFAYVAVVPKTVGWLLSYTGQRITPLINVTQYFGFVAKFCLAFGVMFQLPLVMVLLSALGIVSPHTLWKQWRYGVVLIFVVAAWLTPPDAVSQCMMAGPIVVLYMLSIGLAFLLAPKRRSRD